MHITMLRIRRFEERVAELLRDEIKCPTHLYTGQEAVAAGVCANLRDDDYVFSTHRSHGHYIAKGGDLKALMAELYGKATGCSRGRGGSMHLACLEKGLPGSSAIVGGTIPLAVGTALASSLRGVDTVSVAFFGDGAVNEGIWYESVNFAALKRLPVVFICENNLYSTHMPVSACLADTNIYRKAEAFCIPGVQVDGNDALAVYRAAELAVESARQSEGPTLIECLTYRWRGHVGPNFDLEKGLRNREELASWQARCPIETLERLLSEQDMLSVADRKRIYKDIEREIDEAIAFARQSPYPDQSELLANVFKV
ncbi:MAG: thiamine pyrophosphate-dependent dehydrogenase E1 component subunit alpha [Chloroflexi bacterium]|nr:thiamine pyrophosphate-dependent dehydrogenase E1 component subunit alpha [Chloroflexota bacterium]